MDKLVRLTAEDRDNLTAYLDGELDEQATRRIESILTSSSVARNDVEALARTYELLDLLPRPVAGKEFTEKTLTTVRLDGQKQPLSQREWVRKLQDAIPLACWVAAIFFAACLGYSVTNHWIRSRDDLLLEQFPLIQNLDLYSEIGSIEFLEQLAADQALLDEIQGGDQ